MESGVNKDYKIAVIGSRLLSIGSKLSGISTTYSVSETPEIESALRELLGKSDVGIIIITHALAKKVRDRRLQHAIDHSLMPVIMEVSDFGEQQVETDTLRRMILRALGIDINKMSTR
ncbi:MAG: hypothetical protein KGH49_02485 [Candidatus Micrarchaeota archaeon]|nr:hypothetical protein [Candidatus Micrarchaeota archaeon]